MKRFSLSLFMICLLITESILPIYSQTKDCIKTTIKPIDQKPLQIPANLGNTNNDETFKELEQFADLDVLDTKLSNTNILSVCIYKNNSARILNADPESGLLNLSNSFALADPVSKNDPASIRGICTFNSATRQLFFPGNGPQEFGFDRIYPYNIEISNPAVLNRTKRSQENNINDFYIPSDLATSITVTPNGRFLTYLQADTSNNNLASIQSIEIKADKSLGQSFIGQSLAKSVNAGTFLEYAKNPLSINSRFVFGIFSNLQQGKGGSGDSFSIFKTNQENGVNIILSEFKKGDHDFPLPDLFTNQNFGGFSGFKFVQRGSDLFLFISYFDIDPNARFLNFSYITKLALFKVIIRNDLSKKASIAQIGRPTITVFKTTPCTENNFHGISGPMWYADDFNTIFVSDNNTNLAIAKNENYFASYLVNWDIVPIANTTDEVMRLSSIPIRTSQNTGERNTDLVSTPNNMFAYLITSSTQDINNTKIFGYSLDYTNITCPSLKEELRNNGICDLLSVSTSSPSPSPSPSPSSSPSPSPTHSPPISPSPTPSPFQSPTPQTSQQPTQQGGSVGGVILPIPPSTNTGRPPVITPGPGRPTEFGKPSSGNKPPSAPPKPSKSPTPTPTPLPPSLPILPPIAIIPETPLSSDAASGIDIKSLDLSGPEQIVISPNIPHIIFPTAPLETANIQVIKPDSLLSNPIAPSPFPSPSPSSSPPIFLSPSPSPSLPISPSPFPSPSLSNSSSSGFTPNNNAFCSNGKVFCGNGLLASCLDLNYKTSCINNTPDCCIKTETSLDCKPNLLNCQNIKPLDATPPVNTPPAFCKDGIPSCNSGFSVACSSGAPPCCIENEAGCSVFSQDIIVGCDGGKTFCTPNTLRNREDDLLAKKPKLDQTPIETKEIRAAIKAGAGGHIISLKEEVTIKSNDLKNIIHITIDNEKKITLIPSKTYILNKNKLLAKLAFPANLKNGVVTLVTLLNKGGGKRQVIAKSSIKIFDPLDFNNFNINTGTETKAGLPTINKIQGRIIGDSTKGGKIIRLTFIGKNFASRLIKINDRLFIADPFKTHTILSFSDAINIEILRVRVLKKGNKMLVTLRFTGDDITTIPFTISTPKGHLFNEKIGVKLFSKPATRSVILTLDQEREEKTEKDKKEP